MSSPLPGRFSEAALAAGGVVMVIGLALLVTTDLSDPFDLGVMEVVRAPELRGLLSPLRTITELGSTWAVSAVALGVLGIGLALGMWRHGVAGALTITLASVANSSFKVLIARERPDLLDPIVIEHGFSFPSGHSAIGMAAYGVLAVLVSRSALSRGLRTGVVVACAVVIGLIGLSRVWLGVHFPTDVLAGWTAGAVIVLAYAAITRRVWPVPAAAAADADRAGPRSDRPVPG